MKTLLNKLGEWYDRREKAVLLSLLAAACLLAVPLPRVVPEPETCALCGGFRCHAPCLVRLDTGEVGELRVYDPDTFHRWEISAVQQTGTLSLERCAGAPAVRDTCAHTCTAELTEKPGRLAREYFCGDCRALLAGTADRGYVLADLYDLEDIRIYPLYDGAEYSIRDYQVTVGREDGGDTLWVEAAGRL